MVEYRYLITMVNKRKKELFDYYRRSMEAAGLDTPVRDTLLCPLCWQETTYDELSLEHIVPGAVGGKHCVLTCKQCNNKHGSMFDSHIAQFQEVQDAFKGYATIPVKVTVQENQVAANIALRQGHKNIQIVGKASDPTSVSAIQEDFEAGRVDKFNLTFLLGFAKNNFQTGLLRCAYLAVFRCFGYGYANREVVHLIRRRICEPSLQRPRLGSLIGELRGGSLPFTDSHVIVGGDINGVEFFLVVIQLRKKTRTYHFVFMPAFIDCCDEFYEMMERSSKDNNGKTLDIPLELTFN